MKKRCEVPQHRFIVENSIDMNKVVEECNILIVGLDTLRYDAAIKEQEENGTPTINKYGEWQKRHSPGNFTLPSHFSFFSGFLPTDANPNGKYKNESLFFPRGSGLNRKDPDRTFCYDEATFVEALTNKGLETFCIGGVVFFNKQSPLTSVFPNYFKHSYYKPAFGCINSNSAKNIVDFTCRKVDEYQDKQLMFYLNMTSIHYPNYYHLENESEDSFESHCASLRYVDSQLERLFNKFASYRKTFVMLYSDHGTCYGENGFNFHCLSHEAVNTVPYMHFIIEKR